MNPLDDLLWKTQALVVEAERETTPTVHYEVCDPKAHEAAVEVEGYCPCWDGLHIDWKKTLGGPSGL